MIETQIDESYESIITKNITFTKEFSNEVEFRDWFKKNYKLLGFNAIIKDNYVKYPDFIMERNNTEVRVELETLSSNYILHKHIPEKDDVVFCLVKNCDLSIQIIELSQFRFTKPPNRNVYLYDWLYRKIITYRDIKIKEGRSQYCISQAIEDLIGKEKLSKIKDK